MQDRKPQSNKKYNKQEDQEKQKKNKPIQKKQKEKKPLTKKKVVNNKKSDSQQDQLMQSEEKQYLNQVKSQQNQNKGKKRHKSGAKLGRPFQDQGFIEVCQDPCIEVQACLLEYFDNIGMKHGFVFRRQQRQKLNNEKNVFNIKWNSGHEWDESRQKQKIQRNKKIMDTIKQYVSKNNPQANQDSVNLIIDMFLNIGDIAADQCTLEIYQLLASALQSIQKNQQKDSQAKRAEELYSKFTILNGKFTNIRVKYWLELIDDQQKIRELFLIMFHNLKNKLKNLLKADNFIQFKRFIKQQKEMDQQLLNIKAKNPKKSS